MNTAQEQFWQGQFGTEYTERNNYDPAALNVFYRQTYGVTRSAMNDDFLKGLPITNVLEIGCNVGNQLRLLQSLGYKNLHGIEIMPYAVERAKQLTKEINIIQGSAFDLPFRDNYFDLVFTSGVLIHIHPSDIHNAIAEIYRVAKRYIWGFEYYADTLTEINYRGNNDRLWKTDFSKLFLDQFPGLTRVKEKKYQYRENENQVDVMFLLEKTA